MTPEQRYLSDVCIHTYQYIIECKKQAVEPAVWALDLIINFVENDLENYKMIRKNNGEN